MLMLVTTAPLLCRLLKRLILADVLVAQNQQQSLPFVLDRSLVFGPILQVEDWPAALDR
jgi:hypothetical protein